MSNKNYISECDFSAEILAYLYGEIGKKEKAKFESHLPGCTACTDGLADLAFASFSVREWRDAEFATLATPLINIPFEKDENERVNIIDSTVSDSWLARLRGFVSLSPARAITGGATAALMIVFGLIFASSDIFRPVDTADTGSKMPSKIAVSSPTTDIITAQKEDVYENVRKTENPSEQSSKQSDKNPGEIRREIARENKTTGQTKNVAVTVRENIRKDKNSKQNIEKLSASEQATLKTVAQPANSTTAKLPVLNSFEEEEDNTLRLAELFEDTDTE